MNIPATLYPCKHCNETGVCTTGEKKQVVAYAKYHELKNNIEYTGLACGTCGG